MSEATIKKFSELSGYTPKVVHNKIARGDCLMDIHWRKAPDGRFFINLVAIVHWSITNG